MCKVTKSQNSGTGGWSDAGEEPSYFCELAINVSLSERRCPRMCKKQTLSYVHTGRFFSRYSKTETFRSGACSVSIVFMNTL